jgi:hypothetical protein
MELTDLDSTLSREVKTCPDALERRRLWPNTQ